MQGAPLRLGEGFGVEVKSAVSAGLAREFGAGNDGINGAQPVAFSLAFAGVDQVTKPFHEAGQIRGGNAALHRQRLFMLRPRLGQNGGG